MPAKPTLRFPVFSAAELAEYFNPLVECVTEETLKKPTMHVAMAVYQHVAESILNVKYGRFSSSPQLQEALEEVVDRVTDHSELLRDALPFVSFYRELYV